MSRTIQSTMKQEILKQSIELTNVKEGIEALFTVYAKYCAHNRPNQIQSKLKYRGNCSHEKKRGRDEYPHICISDHCPTLNE